MVGADTSASTISMVDSLLDFIPTNYLKHFTEYVLKNYDRHTKPIVNITSVSQEYKRQLNLALIKKGELTLSSVNETKDFLLEFFKGKEICNRVTGLYLDFVIIALTEDGEFINKYSFKKLDSQEVADFIYWCFINQNKMGTVEIIPSEEVRVMMISNQKRIEELTKELECEKQSTPTTIDHKVSYVAMTALGSTNG